MKINRVARATFAMQMILVKSDTVIRSLSLAGLKGYQLNGEHVAVSFDARMSDTRVETLRGVQNIQTEDPRLQHNADDTETPVDETPARVLKQTSSQGGQHAERQGD